MSDHNNIYNIMSKLDALKPAPETPKQAAERIYESVEAKGSILEGVKGVEQTLSEKYMGFKKTVAAIKKSGTADNPEAVAAAVGRKKYGKAAFQKAAAAGKKMGESEQGVAEGMNDTVYPNSHVIKSKNGKPVGEIYQDANGWGCFHYRADRGYDGIDSREDAIAALKDLHQEIGRSRPDYTIKGVVEDPDVGMMPFNEDDMEEGVFDYFKKKPQSKPKLDYDAVRRASSQGSAPRTNGVYMKPAQYYADQRRTSMAESKVTGKTIESIFESSLDDVFKDYGQKKINEEIKTSKDHAIMKEFIQWTSRRLHLKEPFPRMIFSDDTEKAQKGHHTGVHTPEDNTIWIYTGKRNMVDIMRTVFHELVHERQAQLGMIKPGDSYPGSPIEVMADMLAGKYIKIFGKNHPEIFQ